MSDAASVDRKPLFWEPDKALNFPDIYELICKYQPEGSPVSREIIACIFFEETGFCNRKQKPGPAVGFGQIQIYDNDKIPFFESIGYNSDKKNSTSSQPLITYETITSDKDLSVKLSCQYFQWLAKKGKSLEGSLMAQTGGGANQKFVPLFIEGGKRLRQAINSEQTRESFADALNYARANGIHQNPIPIRGVNAYTKFWEFVIPEEYIMISLADY